MYCPKCGNKQDGNEKFCPKCGTEFPSSNDYYRTIPSNKEKLQQAVEKGKDTANAIANKSLEITDDLRGKVSGQALQINEKIQSILGKPENSYIDFLKRYKIVVIGVCACILLFAITLFFGNDNEEGNSENQNVTEEVNSQVEYDIEQEKRIAREAEIMEEIHKKEEEVDRYWLEYQSGNPQAQFTHPQWIMSGMDNLIMYARELGNEELVQYYSEKKRRFKDYFNSTY